MFNKFFTSFLIIFGLFFDGCIRDLSVLPDKGFSRELTPLEKNLVNSDNVFGLKLFKEIVKQEGNKNVFISPLSVAMALGMTLNGAADETEKAMRNTLEFGNLTQEEINESFKSLIDLLTELDLKVIFQIANSVWYRNNFHVEQTFIDLNKTYFNAEVRSLDFSYPTAPDTINNWVDENTNGKIKEIIDQIDPLTVMFIINAIYFKGIWTNEFDKDLTTDDLFTTSDGSKSSCKMMQQQRDFLYFETEEFQAVDLPYGEGKFNMTILLPKPQKSVDSVITKLTPENWIQWMSMFRSTALRLYFPKFKLEYEISLNDGLTALGMGVAFDPYRANFSQINKNRELYISQVKHKTFVEVNEEGTEAAAVTAVVIGVTSVEGPKITIVRIDRPFIFVIRENQSQTILFLGKIVEPKT